MSRPAAMDIHSPQEGLTPITPNMERGEIYGALVERIPYISKRACTERVMDESGVDTLLDQLIIIQYEEGFELLLDEQEVGYGI